MNSIWNKNIGLFKSRFPALYEIHKTLIEEIDKMAQGGKLSCADGKTQIFPGWQIECAKNGESTATENGTRLHSAYNPSKEAKQAVFETSEKSAVFFGFGLGYLPVEFASKNPDGAIIALESDVRRFFEALLFLDWSDVFALEKCIIALQCPQDQVVPLVESVRTGTEKFALFYSPTFTRHDEAYFSSVKKIVAQNEDKNQINENTKKRFGKLWERNARLNLKYAGTCEGVSIYKDKFKGQKFLLIAAGPSLEKILPHLPELAKKTVTVCVDTALKSTLKAGVEPDFIVLTDPQFWAYLHIAGLSSTKSVLIADAVSYPAVFRFKCKKIVISSSPFPLPDEYKSAYSSKGDLGSGGSVATVAWNFCEFAGASEIYTCGLDLSFPQKQTHIKGSTFEQAAHTFSTRLNSAEKSTSKVMFGADISPAKDYNGNKVLTDTRMKMFAWWFQNRISACPHVKTFTLCTESMVVPGIQAENMEKLLVNIENE